MGINMAYIMCCYLGINVESNSAQLPSEAQLAPRRLRGPGSRLNTLRPRQNGRHFPEDIFKWIFLNENVWIWIKFSLKLVPKGQINNISALVQIMAWHQSGDKPYCLNQWWLVYWHVCITRLKWVNTLRPGTPFTNMINFYCSLDRYSYPI